MFFFFYSYLFCLCSYYFFYVLLQSCFILQSVFLLLLFSLLLCFFLLLFFFSFLYFLGWFNETNKIRKAIFRGTLILLSSPENHQTGDTNSKKDRPKWAWVGFKFVLRLSFAFLNATRRMVPSQKRQIHVQNVVGSVERKPTGKPKMV